MLPYLCCISKRGTNTAMIVRIDASRNNMTDSISHGIELLCVYTNKKSFCYIVKY